ncbi:MAG: HEAT repeat domain-containing protein [Gemmata sp.]
MRHLPPLALLLGLALVSGCGKKPAAPPDEAKGGDADKGKPAPADDPAAWRAKQFAALKGRSDDARRSAVDELSYLVNEDPEVGPGLIELLKDKGTNGSGRTLTNQVNSVREAAALALMKAGPKGEALLKEKGLPVLRDGLSDPSPAVREHSAYTIGQLGPLGKPYAGDVQKLCTDKDANVRGVAFDTLRTAGVADPVALAKLLKDDNEEIVRLAAELLPLVTDMPEAAVAPLVEALSSPNTNIQTAAAVGLAAAGPRAATAVPALVAAITKYYPKENDPRAPRLEGVENAYWFALLKVGPPAVAPTAKLLDHTNALVRSQAARTLGEFGPPARSATDALKKALAERDIGVSGEAAVALCRLGEEREAAVDLLKRAIDAPNEGVARFAIDAISRVGDAGKPLVPLALAKMGDPNPYTRFAAVSLVGRLAPDEAAKSAADVGNRATDEVPDVRRIAGRVLERLGPKAAPAADALGKALGTEREPDIRDQLVEALVAMGPGAKPALPGLLPLLADTDVSAELRAKAALAAVAIDPASSATAAALVKAAGDTDSTVRAAAARAMGQLNPLPADALNALVKAAKADSKNPVRLAAYRALATAGPRAKPARAEIEALTTNPQPGLAAWAKVTLAAVDGDVSKAAPGVRAGLTDRNPAVRASAAEALLLVGPVQGDLPALLKLLKDGSSTTRTAAATAAGRLGPFAKDAVPQLTRQLDEGDGGARAAAAEALGRIGPASLPAVAKLKELRADASVKATAEKALEQIGAK